MSNSDHHDLDVQEYVEIERKYIDETMISMVKKYPFLYDPSVQVDGNRDDVIEATFDYIASKLSSIAVYHDLIGRLIFCLSI